MSKIRILFIIVLAASVTIGCGKSKIFTEIDFSLENIDDIYPAEYRGQRVELRDRQPTYQKQLNSVEYRLGGYGSDVSLEVWEFEKASDAKTGWQLLVDEKDRDKLNSYDSVKTSEYRFNYTTAEEFAGIIWTNKMFLFRIEAENDAVLKDFLKNTKIAKIQ